MTILKDSSGNDVPVCDGCGREDAGPNQPLDIRDYAVVDLNVGAKVRHHYCTHCATNRNASIELLDFHSEGVQPSFADTSVAVPVDEAAPVQ